MKLYFNNEAKCTRSEYILCRLQVSTLHIDVVFHVNVRYNLIQEKISYVYIPLLYCMINI
jgi:hypothetical protein